ncbi:MAG: hypothetical protein IIB38_15335, partial [Candidatus Hydrogenedentes bacterium]|nr:hypothetical protein [Candidatus Hydrogenedentota bacterium]
TGLRTNLPRIPRLMLAALLALVLAGLLVWFLLPGALQESRDDQFETWVEEAGVGLEAALATDAPAARRAALEAADRSLAEAELLRSGDPTVAELRERLDTALADLNAIVTLDDPALLVDLSERVSGAVSLGELELGGGGAYLLDREQGRVIAVTLEAPEPSPVVILESGSLVGTETIGRPQHIAWADTLGTLLVLDDTRRLISVTPGEAPRLLSLRDAQAWGSADGIVFADENLYVLDRQGNPKPAFTATGGFQHEFRAAVRLQRTSVRVREEIRVRVEIINRGKIDGRGDLSLQVVGPTNQVLWKKKRGVKIPAHGRELWEGTVSASGSPGRHTFIAKVFAESGPIAEGSMDFFVYPATSPYARDICILDPDHRWTARCRALAADVSLTAPVHIVPRLANTIRAYPDNDLAHVLGQVRQGAVALIFGPPDDWNAFADLIGAELRATSRLTAGTRAPCFHYIRSHPVFDGLPTRGLMRQEYRYVYPVKTFDEHSDEDICGTIYGGPKTDDTPSHWGTDILVRKYGEGRLVFTHLRILEHLGEDPVADRIFVNMLNHFSRRSVPSRGTVPIHQPSVEWLRRERSERVHRWTVIGVFANRDDKGLDTVYPPEQELNFDATYPGWYDVAIWKPWYSTEHTGHRIDLQDAFSPPYQAGPRCDYGTGYAYAELHSEARATITLRIGVRNAMRVWLNGSILYESREATTQDGLRVQECACSLKQGRNTILVKVAKVPGPFEFSMDSL